MCLCEINLCLNGSKNRKISSVLPEIIAPFDSEKSLKFIAMKKLKRSQRELFTLSCAFLILMAINMLIMRFTLIGYWMC